jgi:hypothetical protein
MGTSTDRGEALRLLEGLENGRMSPVQLVVLAEDLDPVLLYVVVTYLRAAHRASDPAASGILDRVVHLTSTNPTLVRAHKEGERDPVTQWFASEYDYGAFRGRPAALLDIVVDKLES